MGRTDERFGKSWRTVVICIGVALMGPAYWRSGKVDWNGTSAAAPDEGQRLFDHETFGGNGRTCRTCHSGNNGTITLEEVAERLARIPQMRFSFTTGSTTFPAVR